MICYGQTASGKTYTAFGPPELAFSAKKNNEYEGVAPRICREVLKAVDKRAALLEAELSLSYVEIFGNEVNDLLSEGQIVGQGRVGRYNEVRATDRVGHRYVLDGHVAVGVGSFEELIDLLEQGDAAKRRAATAMNERSTRAHTLMILNLRQRRRTGASTAAVDQSPFVESKLCVVHGVDKRMGTRNSSDEAGCGLGRPRWWWSEWRGSVNKDVNDR